jgi:hypothetical protein
MNSGKRNMVILILSFMALILLAPGQNWAQSVDYFIPQVADGGGFKTFFTVTNLSASTNAQFFIQVVTDPAYSLNPLLLNIPGQTGGRSSGTVAIQPGGQVTLSTVGGSSLSVGWADITSSNVGVSAVYVVLDGMGNVTGAAGVLPQASQASTTVIGLIKPNAKTGVAVLNPSANTAHITFKLVDAGGGPVSTDRSVTLAPLTRIVQFFNESPLFTDVTDFDGSVQIDSDVPVQILTIRLDFPSISISTLPNLPGRTGTPVVHADATFNWIDATLAGGGLRVTIPGDVVTGDVNGKVASLGRPFPMNFYGTIYGIGLFDTISLSEDGWMSFGNGTASPPQPLPSASVPPSLAAPFFADFHFNANDPSVGVFSRMVGTAPNRQFVLEWVNVSFVNAPWGTATFEVILYEGSSDIKMQYLTVGNDVNSAIAAGSLVIGIQDDTRTLAVPVDLSTGPPHPNKVYTFQYMGGTNYTLLQNP